jgi:hypothetical protein
LEAPSIAFKPSFESYEILLCSLSIVNLDGLSSKLKIGERKKKQFGILGFNRNFV